MVTPAPMELTFRVMSAQCPTTQTGTTSQPLATAIHLQGQLVIVQETIPAVHTIMELAIPSIQVPAEGSIITIATDIRPTFQRGTCGKDIVPRIGGIRKVALNSFLYHPTI